MAEHIEAASDNNISFTRALSLPLFALVLALLLIYAGPPTEVSNIGGQIVDPDKLGGYHLRRGLRNIAIVFGLSCFTGAVIGTGLGWLIARSPKIASVSLLVLRIGQWAPFLLWWALTWELLVAPSEHPGRFFFIRTMSIPAVALGSCYHFLCTRHLLQLDWRTSVSESMGLACHRALFISLVLALSVWVDNWVVLYANENGMTHYVAAFVLALFLLIVNGLYRSGIDHSAALYREILVADLSRRREASFWTATLIVMLIVAVWQMLNLLGYFRVSPVSVFNVTFTLISGAEIWQNMWTSIREIIAGIVFSGTLVLIISGTLLINPAIRKWTLSILSLTFAIPIVMLPA